MDNSNGYNDSVSSFTSNSYVRSTWIALFTLWVFWGLAYIFRHVFVSDNEAVNVSADPAAPAAQDPETGQGKTKFFLHKAQGGFARRFNNFERALRHSLFMLLCVIALNTLGVGSTRAVLILSWIFVAFAMLYAIADFIFEHRLIRTTFSTILYALGLAIGGSAIARGWHLF